MSSKVVVNVLYRRTTADGSPIEFNMDYYLNKHIPMAKKAWTPHGLESMVVTEVPEGSDFAVMVPVVFRDMDAWQAAAACEETKAVVADVPNFSNQRAEMVIGKVVGYERAEGV